MELPQDSEDQNAGTDVSRQESHGVTVTEETLQDLMNSDKYTLEDTLRLLDALAGETDEFMGTLPSDTCTKSEVTCPKPDVARSTSDTSLIKVETETSTKGETANAPMEEKRSKEEITCAKDEITCVEDETKGLSDDVTCTKDVVTRPDNKVASAKDEVTCPDNKVTCTKDESTCPADDNTCTKDEVACETREESIATRDNTPVSIEIDENSTDSIYEIIEESTEVNNDKSDFSMEKESLVSPDKLNAQASSHKSSPTKYIQGSFRSLIFPGDDVRSILSDTSFIPKVPSDFALVPYDVESELLLPIKIDSDLLLLNDDSFTDLSLEDDRIKTDDEEVQKRDNCTEER